jgi:hypothetical protein
MRIPLLPVAFLLLTACGTPATLVTDDLFRTAAPEVVRAWNSLSPLKAARTETLPAGAGLPVLKTRIAALPLPRKIMVGAALTADERAALVQAFPTDRFVFFVPGASASGQPTLTVNRADAWALVAGQAARAQPGGAAVLFPEDASPEETQRFASAWTKAGGGTLQVRPANDPSPWNPMPSQVFQWAGPVADPVILALPASVPVHGNPGTVRTAGARGLTWKIRETDLANLLWNTVQDSTKKTIFLPLETKWVSR